MSVNDLSNILSMQYDFGAWMPNYPTTMQLPPPTKKGEANRTTMMNTFPDVNTTVHGMGTMWLLSKSSADCVSALIRLQN